MEEGGKRDMRGKGLVLGKRREGEGEHQLVGGRGRDQFSTLLQFS